MDREAWCATIHGVTKNWTRLSNWMELNWMFQNLKYTRFSVRHNISVFPLISYSCQFSETCDSGYWNQEDTILKCLFDLFGSRKRKDFQCFNLAEGSWVVVGLYPLGFLIFPQAEVRHPSSTVPFGLAALFTKWQPLSWSFPNVVVSGTCLSLLNRVWSAKLCPYFQGTPPPLTSFMLTST